MPLSFHRLSQCEELLFPVQNKSNEPIRKAIDSLVSANLLLLELISQMPLAKVEYKKVEGGEGGIKKGWVVEIGVTHTISKKNPDNSYSKKIFPNKFSAQRALKEHVKDMKRMVQLYVEDELTDEEWLDSLKLHGRRRKKNQSHMSGLQKT